MPFSRAILRLLSTLLPPRGFGLGWLLVCGPLTLAAAPPPSPRETGSAPLRVWHTEEFGASAINWDAVIHPRTGFLYVGNSTGVLEFDGVRWRLIPMPHGVAARKVLVGPDGRVWAAGSGNVAVLEPDPVAASPTAGQLVARDVAPRIPAHVFTTSAELTPANATGDDAEAPGSGLATLVGVNPVILAAPDGVYLRLRRQLVRFGAGETVTVFETPESQYRVWLHDDALHLVTRSEGIHRLAAPSSPPSAVPPDRSAPSPTSTRRTALPGDTRVLDTTREPDGSWLWLTATGPWRVRGEHAEPLGSPAVRELLRRELNYNATFLPGGGAAYATSRHGLVLLDAGFQRAQIVDRSRGLGTDRVNGVAHDAQGGLWLALHFGLVRLQLDSPFARHGITQGITGSPRALASARGHLYVAHSEGLVRRDSATGVFHAVTGFAGGINQVAADGGDVLATGAGLFALSPDTDTAVRCSDTTTRYGIGLGRTQPEVAFVGGGLDLWLFRRSTRDGAPAWAPAFKFENMPTGANGIFDDGAGSVWIASRSDGRIRRLEVRDRLTAQAPITTFGPEHGLPAMSAADKVRLLRTGNAFFVVSRRGAWRWDSAANRFFAEPRLTVDGAGPEAIASAENEGWLYFAQPQPLLRRVVVRSGQEIVTEDRPEPLLRGLVVNALHLEPEHNTLWLACQGQLVSCDLRRRPETAPPPPVAVFRRVTAPDGTTVWSAPAFAPANSATILPLPADRRALRIEFTAPSFLSDVQANTQVRFRTRLAGLDAQWTRWSDEPHRDLTNLPDGALRLELQAMDVTGRIGPPAQLALTLQPPWWRTPWARAGFACAAVGAVLGVITLRTRTLRRRNRQLEEVVTARTAELARLRQIDRDAFVAARLGEEKARLETLRYQLNPHFLYNALNSIRALTFSHPTAAGEMVTQLAELCRITLTRNEHLAPVAEEFAMLRLYLEMEQTRWRDKLAVTFDLDPAAARVPIPPFLLLPLVENALKHGRQTTTGVLRLRLGARLLATDAATQLELEIANTGTWLEPGTSTAPSTGIGLENLRQRLTRYFPGTHRFTTQPDAGWVRATIVLPAPVSASAPPRPPPP